MLPVEREAVAVLLVDGQVGQPEALEALQQLQGAPRGRDGLELAVHERHDAVLHTEH